MTHPCRYRSCQQRRLVLAGPPITSSGGHCWYLGGEADGIDGVRRSVRDHAARGVDVVKVMVTGGEITRGSVPHLSQYSHDELGRSLMKRTGLV